MVLCVAEKGGVSAMNDSEKITGSLALKPKPRIITIPATGQDLTRPLRVAAYARVQTEGGI